MSRLTGNEVRGLMEAYQAVYAPQELTEEQVWEEVEEWVNALVEEGYDLSDYTWEEMYESYITEVVPLAIPAAAPYILPALAAAAGVAKGLMNRGKAKNTPEEERFLNTGSFAARVTSSDARDKKPARTKRETPTEIRQRVDAARAARKAANPKPEVSNTPVSGRTIRNPVSPSQLSASNRPGAASSSGSGGSQKPPGFGEKFRRKLEDARAKKEAAKEARRAKPNPIGQAVSDTAADLTARGVNKLGTLAKWGGGIAAGLGAAQLATDGLVGKVARDAYNLTRQAGPAYDKLRGRENGTTPSPSQQPKLGLTPQGTIRVR